MAKSGLLHKLTGLIMGVLTVDNGYNAITNFKDFIRYSWLKNYLVDRINDMNYNHYLEITDKIKVPLSDITLHLNDEFNKNLYNNFTNDLTATIGFCIATYFLIKRGIEIDSNKHDLENKISTYEIKDFSKLKK